MYFEIDSWIPHELAPFLAKGKEPRVFEGIEGERLRTVKLRGQISQGLLLPHDIVWDKNMFDFNRFEEGDDVTELLGIQKWEAPLSAQLAGVARGNFPSFIRKTDQERIQNLKREIQEYIGDAFVVEEKLDGSSMTVYLYDGEFGVCSRNLNLKESEDNTFWKVARELNLEAKLSSLGRNIAFQGELIGPGIQKNPYKLVTHEFHIFDVYDIHESKYLDPSSRRKIVDGIGLINVPMIVEYYSLPTTIDEILNVAAGKSLLSLGVDREGVVIKHMYKQFSFKAISNEWLLRN